MNQIDTNRNCIYELAKCTIATIFLNYKWIIHGSTAHAHIHTTHARTHIHFYSIYFSRLLFVRRSLLIWMLADWVISKYLSHCTCFHIPCVLPSSCSCSRTHVFHHMLFSLFFTMIFVCLQLSICKYVL